MCIHFHHLRHTTSSFVTIWWSVQVIDAFQVLHQFVKIEIQEFGFPCGRLIYHTVDTWLCECNPSAEKMKKTNKQGLA